MESLKSRTIGFGTHPHFVVAQALLGNEVQRGVISVA
jgi:hypothetical protein